MVSFFDSTKEMRSYSSSKKLLAFAFLVVVVSFVFFGASYASNSNRNLLRNSGEALLVIAALFVLAAAVSETLGRRRRRRPHTPTGAPDDDVAALKDEVVGTKDPDGVLLILSADSWCGFSKKMTAAVPELKSALAPLGVTVQLVSDADDKNVFQKLAQEHSATGFPHSVLFVHEVAVASVPGYFPPTKMKELVESKLK